MIIILLVIDIFVFAHNSTKTIAKCNQLVVNFEECEESEDYSEEIEDNVNHKDGSIDRIHPGLDWRKLIDFVTNRLTNEAHSKTFDIGETVKEISQKVYQMRDFFSKMNDNLMPIESRLRQSGFEFLLSLNVSNQCFQSMVQMRKALNSHHLWPLKCDV